MRRSITMLLILAAIPAGGYAFDVLWEGESPYHHVRVTQEDGYRFLAFERARGRQSAMKLDDPTFLYYMYARTAFVGLAYLEQPPQDVLFVGLGGASMPRFMRKHYPDVQMDVVEVDPLVIKVAKEFFQFNPGEKTNVYEKDGRVFVSKIDKTYDMIFLDAYNARSIPFHLTTQEFLEEVRAKLKPNGVVVSNIWSPQVNEYYDAEIKTFQAVFPELYIFRALSSGNYIFIATNQPGKVSQMELENRAERIDRERNFHFNLEEIIHSTYRYATNSPVDAPVLTDDHAPVNVMRWNTRD